MRGDRKEVFSAGLVFSDQGRCSVKQTMTMALILMMIIMVAAICLAAAR